MLGTILSIGGLGFLGGSLTMSAWGGPRVRVYGIYVPLLLQGVVLFVAGFPPQVTILATAVGFLYPRLRWVERELPDIILDGDLGAGEVVAGIELSKAPLDEVEL